jgi:hypothetical protein
VEAWLAAERRYAAEMLARRFGSGPGSQGPPFRAVVSATGRVVHADPPKWLESPVRIAGRSGVVQGDGAQVEAEPIEDGYLVWRGDEGRPRGDQVSVAIGGRARAVVTTARGRTELNLRHSEILALLALHPEGMTVRDLALGLYGSTEPTATVRAEITRLRRRVGLDVVLSRPYRLHGRVSTDVRDGAGGPLLPESRAPGVARCSLDAAFQAD